jgi:hypothetical protein
MSMQLSDGFSCFMGTNPNDPTADCSNAAYLLLAYIVVNFFYNILMLAIMKRGSAVLLVISQVTCCIRHCTLAIGFRFSLVHHKMRCLLVYRQGILFFTMYLRVFIAFSRMSSVTRPCRCR